MDDYRNMDRIHRFIQQQDASLLPNEYNGELPSAYRHYVNACEDVDPAQLSPEHAARLAVAPRYAPEQQEDVAALLDDYLDAHGLPGPRNTGEHTVETVQDGIESVLDGAVHEHFPALDDHAAHEWTDYLCRAYVRRGAELLEP